MGLWAQTWALGIGETGALGQTWALRTGELRIRDQQIGKLATSRKAGLGLKIGGHGTWYVV